MTPPFGADVDVTNDGVVVRQDTQTIDHDLFSVVTATFNEERGVRNDSCPDVDLILELDNFHFKGCGVTPSLPLM